MEYGRKTLIVPRESSCVNLQVSIRTLVTVYSFVRLLRARSNTSSSSRTGTAGTVGTAGTLVSNRTQVRSLEPEARLSMRVE